MQNHLLERMGNQVVVQKEICICQPGGLMYWLHNQALDEVKTPWENPTQYKGLQRRYQVGCVARLGVSWFNDQ